MIYDVFYTQVFSQINSFLRCAVNVENYTDILEKKLADYQKEEQMVSPIFDNPVYKADTYVMGRALFEMRIDIKRLKEEAIPACKLFQEWVEKNQEPLEQLKEVFKQIEELIMTGSEEEDEERQASV